MLVFCEIDTRPQVDNRSLCASRLNFVFPEAEPPSEQRQHKRGAGRASSRPLSRRWTVLFVLRRSSLYEFAQRDLYKKMLGLLISTLDPLPACPGGCVVQEGRCVKWTAVPFPARRVFGDLPQRTTRA